MKNKKILAMVACAGVLLTGTPVITYAATGNIEFSDPNTKVGDTVEVKCMISVSDDTLTKDEIILSYDTSALKFISGDKVTDSGNGTLTCTGNAGAKGETFTINFQALREGGTQILVAKQNINTQGEASCNFPAGNATVNIAAGDASKVETVATEAKEVSKEATDSEKKTEEAADEKESQKEEADSTVEVDGVAYSISDFDEKELPQGYKKAAVTYKDKDYSMGYKEKTGVYLAYLKPRENKEDSENKDNKENKEETANQADFFLFDNETETFSPYAEIAISETATIVVLSDDNVDIPSKYQETTLTLNDKEFPVWQNMERDGYYLIYALDSNGEKSFYEYDSEEDTYQKCDIDQELEEEQTDEIAMLDESKEAPEGFLGTIYQTIMNNLYLFAGVVGVIILLLIVRLIILRVQLSRRDSEIDEIFQEDMKPEDALGVDAVDLAGADDWLDDKPKKKLFGGSRKEKQDAMDDLRIQKKHDAAQMARLRQENTSLMEGNEQLSHKIAELKGELTGLEDKNESLTGLLEETKQKHAEAMDNTSLTSILPPRERVEELEVISLVQGVVDQMRTQCSRVGIRLEVSTSSEEILYPADKRYMEFAIQNIIDNSMKYMQRNGNLVITVSQTEDSIFIACKDNGKGLPASELPQIFDLNFQGSNRVSGNGLGLAQVKAIVEHYHGSVYAHSVNGMGIYMQLPLSHSEEATENLEDVHNNSEEATENLDDVHNNSES